MIPRPLDRYLGRAARKIIVIPRGNPKQIGKGMSGADALPLPFAIQEIFA